MTPEQPPRISVIDPISPAFEKVNLTLFKPFDIGKWFVIGFCAFLAYLGQGGVGLNFRFNVSYRGQQPAFQTNQPFQWPEDFEPDEFFEEVKDFAQQAEDFAIDNLPWFILGGSIFAMLIITIGVLIIWLSSRGRFMFLHCVALNKAEVKVPWHKFRHQGNSLFLFRIVVGIISFVFFALLIGVMAFITFIAAGTHAQIGALATVALILLSIIILVPVAIAFALFWLFWKFTNDFVVPIMYLRASTCTDAWREFWTLLTGNKGRFTLYILFQIVIAIVIRVILIPLMCIACCCCCIACILSLPYIGTVALLPIFVFKRSYSLCYFRQFGPDFDVFTPETEAA